MTEDEAPTAEKCHPVLRRGLRVLFDVIPFAALILVILYAAQHIDRRPVPDSTAPGSVCSTTQPAAPPG